MMRKLFLLCVGLLVINGLHAQIDVVRQISMEKDAGQSKLYLMYEDSVYRLLAPESAIREILKPFKETDKLPLAFKELNNENSTNYHDVAVKHGLASESQFLIHELMERGDCLIEQKPDRTKVKAVVAMTYKDGSVEGIKYMIGDHVLYNYIDPKRKS